MGEVIKAFDNLICTAYLFADDMKLFNGITQDADIARLQSDICAIDTWTDHWLLKLDAEKCKVMTVSRCDKHRPTGTSYHLPAPAGGSNHKEKDLGVVMTVTFSLTTISWEKLRWQTGYSGWSSTASRILTSNVSCCFTKLWFAVTWSMPRQYGAHTRSSQSRPWKVSKDVRQRSFLVLATWHKERLPTLVYRRARGDMIEVYKILHGYYDPEAAPCLQQCIYPSTRGHTWKLYQLQSHLNCRKCSFTVRVVGRWNKLSDDVVNAPSVLSFESSW